MKKIFLTGLFLLFGMSLFPSPALAIDQRCWEKSKCIEVRARTVHFADQRPEDGFIQNAETLQACGKSKQTVTGKEEEVGFCLPVGTTETKISFGGKRKFSDIADFIKYMYRYSIMAAGVISVLMIIVAGFQWAASGGNSSTIESARKRINGALMGLTIAVLSYSVLNFVNPNLVNFRLPGVWLINTIEEYGKYCTKVPDDKRLAILVENVAKSPILSNKKKDEKYNEAKFDVEPKAAKCGNSYFVQDGQGLSCLGTQCETGQVCDIKSSECKPGVIAGKISNSGFTAGLLDHAGGVAARAVGKWLWTGANHGWIMNGAGNIKDAVQIVRVCNGDLNESSYNKVASVSDAAMEYDLNKKEQTYIVPLSDVQGAIADAKENCKGDGGLKGFMLEVGVHEATPTGNMTEVHFLGKKDSNAIDLGDSDAIGWVLGRSAVNELLIKPEELLQGLIIDINVGNIYNNEDDDASLQHYKTTFK